MSHQYSNVNPDPTYPRPPFPPARPGPAVPVVGTIPQAATDGSAGYDLAAAHTVLVREGHVEMVEVDLKLALPPGVAMLLLPRSSSAKNGLMLANTVGLIDPDYRGPVLVALTARWGDVQVRKGDRVAQALFVPFVRPVFQQVAELDATGRGAGGFGSTR